MFGMNITQSLMFQNIIKNNSQEKFDIIINYSDTPLDDLETCLNSGDFIYDLLTEDQKNVLNTMRSFRKMLW